MIFLDTDRIKLENNKASVKIKARTLRNRNDRLVVDIYLLNGSRHPEDHLGWWLFHFKRNLQGTLLIDFNEINKKSISLNSDRNLSWANDCWFNPEFKFSPVQDLHIVIRDRNNNACEQETYQLINDSSLVLKRFYDNLHATDGYKTGGNTILQTLHKFKLCLLKDIFTKYIKNTDNVLDVGCGNSLFTEINAKWKFDLICCDLGEPVIRERIKHYPEHTWMVTDVLSLPFKNEKFDALFAGEIIEHMTSVSTTLGEWNRVLKPGGKLILTTPNRKRLRNRVNHSRRPLGEDHINELSFDELHFKLAENGFKTISAQGFYIELFLNWWHRGTKVDYLQSSGNTEKNIPWINMLNKLGQRFPKLAFGLIFVAEKINTGK